MVNGVKDKTLGLFKTNATKDYIKPKRVKNVYHGGKKPRKLKIKKQSEDNIIKSIRNLFRLEKKNETIKNRVIRDVNNLFEQEKDY